MDHIRVELNSSLKNLQSIFTYYNTLATSIGFLQALSITKIQLSEQKQTPIESTKSNTIQDLLDNLKNKVENNDTIEKLLQREQKKKQTIQDLLDETKKKAKKTIKKATTQTNDTIEKMLNRALQKHYTNKLQKKEPTPIREEKETIQDLLDEHLDQIKKSKSSQLATTFTTSALNAATIALSIVLPQTYSIWITKGDEKVRPSHEEQDQLILDVSTGAAFPNGCHYPGDPTADPSEFINCRCRLTTFWIPDGYAPPPDAEDGFYEEDLIKDDTAIYDKTTIQDLIDEYETGHETLDGMLKRAGFAFE